MDNELIEGAVEVLDVTTSLVADAFGCRASVSRVGPLLLSFKVVVYDFFQVF